MTYKKEEKMKLGIDMGGMSIKMGLVNEENEIIGRITIPTDLTVPYQVLACTPTVQAQNRPWPTFIGKRQAT